MQAAVPVKPHPELLTELIDTVDNSGFLLTCGGCGLKVVPVGHGADGARDNTDLLILLLLPVYKSERLLINLF